MTDHIIKAAREASLGTVLCHNSIDGDRVWIEGADWHDELERFYAIAYRAGMERAAEICDGLKEKTLAAQQPAQLDDLTNTQIRMVAHLGHGNCAEEIRAHAQNQPKNEHDGSVV